MPTLKYTAQRSDLLEQHDLIAVFLVFNRSTLRLGRNIES